MHNNHCNRVTVHLQLNIIIIIYNLYKFSFYRGHTLAWVVSHRSVPVETQDWCWPSPGEICSRDSGNVTDFSPSILFFFLSVSFQQCHILTFILVLLLSKQQMGEAWQPSNEAMFFQVLGSTGQKKHSNFSKIFTGLKNFKIHVTL
jgi:hypothetical protein